MYSMRKILLCFLLFNTYGLFFCGENFVFAFEELFSPGLAVRSGIKTAIKASSQLLGSWKPLTIFTAMDETSLVNLTSKSLDMRILTPKTVATITGGVFGKDNYEFHKYSMFWKIGSCDSCNETSLGSRVYFFNLKYHTFEKALDHDDGVIVLNFPIATNGDFPNPLFHGLSKVIGNTLKRPGDCSKVHCAFTYRWYVNFPLDSVYTSYKADFDDEEFGKKFCARVINLPADPHLNYVSKEQFKQTFGKLKDISQEAVSDEFIQDAGLARTPVERHAGICILNLPA
ncbi:uncharacterized protein LOC135837052 [Planococcus citri]|uniref:uncharacterized protein LOC135837052 n=1 Tax=Planococcus citri TaxID=170843 RepID=UPI0031F755DE